MLHIDVAGIHMALECEAPLRFAPDRLSFRGFATQECTPTVNVSVRLADNTPMLPDCQYFFDCPRDRRNAESLCSWRLCRTAAGVETIVTQFDADANADVEWLRLTLSEPQLTLEVKRRRDDLEYIDPYQYPLFNIALARLLLTRSAAMVHSSVVDDGGAGYLFTAPSGTGKSTMARIWQSCGATIINDDMLAVRLIGNDAVASNIPMPYYIDTQRTASLRGIFLISQSKDNYIRPLRGTAAALRLLSNSIYHPFERSTVAMHIRTIEEITRRVPVFELGFRPDAHIVEAVRQLKLRHP